MFSRNTDKSKVLATVTTLVLVMGFVLPATYKASADVQPLVLKFYINPSLVADMTFAKRVLPKYVADMNYVLAKNTNHQLVFNPDTDIIATTIMPGCGCAGTLPASGFEVWAQVTQSTTGYSYSGTMSFDRSGAAVLDSLKWSQIYDPDLLISGSVETRDYWIQIDHMLHEFAHVFGAGLGEYYNLAQVNDTTGQAPLLNINVNDLSDSYWGSRSDFQTDPLLRMDYGLVLVGNPTSRSALLNTVKYSNLTAAIMSGGYRYPTFKTPMPDLNNIHLRVIDSSTGLPLPNATVKIWQMVVGNQTSSLQTQGTTDAQGEFIFPWGTPGDPHNNWDFLKLIKVYSGSVSKAQYVSIYDADAAKLVNGQDTFVVNMSVNLNTPPPPPPPPPDIQAPTVSFTSPAANATLSGAVTVSANASDNVGVASVEFFLDGSRLGSVLTAAPYTIPWDSSSASDGPHSIGVIVRDAAGNAMAMGIQVTVNNNFITTVVSITAPANGAPVSNTVTVSGSVSGSAGITKVEFYRDNNILIGTDTSSPYSVSWDTNTAGAGPHDLFAKAYDSLGNVAVSQSITVNVVVIDTTLPTSAITSPVAGSRVKGQVSIVAEASDNVGVSKVEFYRNNALIESKTTAPYTFTWNTALNTDGNYDLYVTAYDSAGNQGQSGTVNVLVDNTGPQTAITSPVNGANVSNVVNITADSSDASGTAKVGFYRDNAVLISTDTLSPFAVNLNTALLSLGVHTLYTKSTDILGNILVSQPITVNVVVDTTAPTTVITSPLNGSNAVRRTTITISADASDFVNVKKVEFYVNGVRKCNDTAAAYTCDWLVPNTIGVVYSLQTWAYDPAGNIGLSPTVSVTSIR